MKINEIKKRAEQWKEETGRSGQGGVVVFFGDEISGWMSELRDPQKWEPGCIAIDVDGLCFKAVGGNKQDGAAKWQKKEAA